MRISAARSTIIFGSMFSIVLITGGLLMGAALNFFPLSISSASGILKISLPPFFCYLGAACHYIFSSKKRLANRDVPHLGQLLIGSFAVFYSIVLFSLASFYFVNSPNEVDRKINANDFSVDALETFFSLSMSFLSITTGVLVAYIFSIDSEAKRDGQ